MYLYKSSHTYSPDESTSMIPLVFLCLPFSLSVLIKSPALWYTAKSPGHFYGLLGPLFLPSIAPCLPHKMSDATPSSHANPESFDFCLSWQFFFPNWDISCPAHFIWIPLENVICEWFSFWSRTQIPVKLPCVVFQFGAPTVQLSHNDSIWCSFIKWTIIGKKIVIPCSSSSPLICCYFNSGSSKVIKIIENWSTI